MASLERIYLRFGSIRPGGRTYNAALERYEDGVSTFDGFKEGNGYRFDVPEGSNNVGLLVVAMMSGARLCRAHGKEVGRVAAGEAILRDVELVPIAPGAPVAGPAWWPKSGQDFAAAWNAWRRRRMLSGHRGAKSPRELVRAAVLALMDVQSSTLPILEVGSLCTKSPDPSIHDVLRDLGIRSPG